ncbi:MAG: YebC/PmpR family DNA-binding transcriptional regulator, partial [Pirellulaceae bacterium]|nr:YebC/PmpR family DNA-binding transcriptional regulator [Pirellulaceae bacterium]
TGELESEMLDETIYEGYGPGGVAVMCEIMTDNRNRTAPEIRKIFEGCGGKLGATNCDSWLFERKGVFVIAAAKASEDRLMEITLDAGAEDIKNEGDVFLVTCPVDSIMAVAEALTAAGIEPESKQITRIPTNTVEVTDPDVAKDVLKLVELLDDHDDVQSVSANFSITDEVLAAAGK